MKLEKWALIAEIIGGIAIVVSLIFVGYEVRQNTQATQIAAYQQLINGISEFNIQTLENPDLRAVRNKLESGTSIEELNPDEQQIINAFLYLTYRNGDMAYMQYRGGLIDEERLISGMGILVKFLAIPTVQSHWNQAKSGFVDEYSDYIDALIETTGSQ